MTESSTALTELLTEQNARLQALEALLMEEQQALVARDMETLQGLLSRKVELLGAVEAAERRRNALVAEITSEPNPTRAMEACIDSLSVADEVRQLWTSLLQSLERCGSVNEANGTVIERRRAGVQRTMELLQGDATPSTGGYGPGADSPQSNSGGREISQA